MKTHILLTAFAAIGFPLAMAADDPSKPETPPKDPSKEEPVKPPAKEEPDAAKPSTLIGLPLADAEAAADKVKIAHRVIKVDGQPRPATRDLRPDRLNFTVVKGIVTEVTKG